MMKVAVYGACKWPCAQELASHHHLIPALTVPAAQRGPPRPGLDTGPLPHSVPSAAHGSLPRPLGCGLDSVIHRELPHSHTSAQCQTPPTTVLFPKWWPCGVLGRWGGGSGGPWEGAEAGSETRQKSQAEWPGARVGTQKCNAG